jgi:hypothetical protein
VKVSEIKAVILDLHHAFALELLRTALELEYED